MAREALFDQRFAMIEGVSILGGYIVVACEVCGATFADRIPSQETFDDYYRESSKYVYSQRDGAESPDDAVRLGVSASVIAQRIVRRDIAIIDIGCASGRLLAELRKLGYTNLRGIDPSPECVAAARRLHGVNAEPLTLADLAERREHFDLIVLIGVLEHLVNVSAAFDSLRRITREGSRIYVEVPDVRGFADLPNVPFQEFSVEHVNFFSLASLTRVLATAGFRVEWFERGAPVQAGSTRVSNLAVMAVRDDAPSRYFMRDSESRMHLERYLASSRRDEEAVVAQVDALVNSHERFVLWGAGTFALRLLETSGLADANIASITDSNRRYHGRSIRGIPVVSPAEAAQLGLPFVVASRAFADDITVQIRGISGPDALVRRLGIIT